MESRTWIAIVTTVLLTACSAVPAEPPVAWAMKKPAHGDMVSREILIGRWYAETVESSGTKMAELKDLHRNGTYQITFRKIDREGHVTDQTEVGLWGVSGKTFFSILQATIIEKSVASAPAGDPDNYDAYEITKLDPQVLEIVHNATHQRFISKKVSATFQFPSEI